MRPGAPAFAAVGATLCIESGVGVSTPVLSLVARHQPLSANCPRRRTKPTGPILPTTRCCSSSKITVCVTNSISRCATSSLASPLAHANGDLSTRDGFCEQK
eukprot:2391679-Prymnesium_polylepis.1